MAQFDVVVVGLGAMGAAALRELARRGLRVAGIERLAPGHDRGSSHGETRIIRVGYFEHPSYVPLLRRSYELWRALEENSRRKLMRITGIVEIGMPHGPLVSGTLLAAREHDLLHEILNATDIMRRFPAFHIPSEYIGIFQPDGGFVAAEATVEALLALARAAKAEIKHEVHVNFIAPNGRGVRIATSAGEIDARIAIVAAGPWLKTLIPQLPAPVRANARGDGLVQATRSGTARRPEACRCSSSRAAMACTTAFQCRPRARFKIAKHHHRDETIDPDESTASGVGHDEALDPGHDRKPRPGGKRPARCRQDLRLHHDARP